MKVAIDIHNTIDARPRFFSKLTKLLRSFGAEIHITTGVPISPKLIEELAHWKISYDQLFSITDYHASKGTPIEWDMNGNPWIEEEAWDRTKAQYCQRNAIDLAIDDSPVYGNYFNTPYMKFEKENVEEEGTAYRIGGFMSGDLGAKVLGELPIIEAGKEVKGGYVITKEDLKLAAELFPDLVYNEKEGTLVLPIKSDDVIMEKDK